MLVELHIKNYALIKELHLTLNKHLNIITGETGAGKSIILGALGLILGNRADSKFLENNPNKCIIEGHFIVNDNLKLLFDEHELDFEEINILRREISTAGKSRAFINDTPVTLQTLKTIGENLVDIHSQHSNLLLADANFRTDVIDTLAKNQDLLQQYQDKFKEYKQLLNQLNKFKEEQNEIEKNKSFLQFQYDEIAALNLKADEYEENELLLEKLNNAEKIAESLNASIYIFDNESSSLISGLTAAQKLIASISKFDPELAELNNRINSSLIELNDINDCLSSYADNIEIDSEKLELLNQRQQAVQKLMRKHQVEEIADLIALKVEIEEKLNNAENAIFNQEKLEKQLEVLKTDCVKTAKKLSESRIKIAKQIEQKMHTLLKGLGIPDAYFKIETEPLAFEKYSLKGAEKINYLFSANNGIRASFVHQGASGGELSRIMLALKYLLADSSHFPTMVFDEIDLGISGEVAIQMGKIIQKLSQSHQVLSITHLPQIAAMGKAHFKVTKEKIDNQSFSTLRQLTDDERVNELGQMIAGNLAGEQALQSARELLQKFAFNN